MADDEAWNLSFRINNALLQTFNVNNLNELTTAARSGNITVAGGVSATPANVTVKDNANPALSATVYEDDTFARENVTLLNGENTFVTVAENAAGQTTTNVSVSHLPVSAAFYYDVRGNLTNDGRRVFFYDDENQLSAVVVSNAWLSRFQYDGLMRRRVRTEYTWLSGSGQWQATNEVRSIYDGRVVFQERHFDPRISMSNPERVISYTRGNDLSGSFEGAGGIGGLLARTDHNVNSVLRHALYHADGNGNITALLSTNGLMLAKYHYDPYGNTLAGSGPLAGVNLYRFSSKEYHPQSGLVYYLYRYYEPKLQRWVTRDQMQEVGGINLFRFVGNSPMLKMDPFGLYESCPLLRATVPGQISWDNAMTCLEQGRYGGAIGWGCAMIGEQFLVVCTLGRCNASASQLARQNAMVAEARAAALKAALQRRDAARTALSLAEDSYVRAVARMDVAAEQLGQIERQLGGRNFEAYESAVQAWRAAQLEVGKLKRALDAALKNWEAANAAALKCGR